MKPGDVLCLNRHWGRLTGLLLLSVSLLAMVATSVPAQSFVSQSLKEETVTAPNGAVTVQDALNANELMGADRKVVDEITEGVYHLRGWGLAHTIAIDAPEGFIIVELS